MFEDPDDDELTYEDGHSSIFAIQLQMGFEVISDILQEENIEDVDIKEFIHFDNPNVYEA